MGKIAFLFSGQGAQYPGMMKDLCENIKECAQVFQIADESLQRPISDICFNGSQQDLNLTHNTQPCMLAADLAAYMAIRKKIVKPDAVAGFSVGEYAALVAAGVMRIQDVFPLVQLRADFMQDAVPIGKGAMAAIVGADENCVRELCRCVNGYVEPSNYNCPGQIVVSGEKEAVKELIYCARLKRIKAVMLPVSAPFHCCLMEPAAKCLIEPLNKLIFENPICPIYMNVDANPVNTAEKMKEKMIMQVKSPVCWEQILRNMYTDGIDIFIEFGPGGTLTRFVEKTLKDAQGIHVMQVSDVETFEKTIHVLEEIYY